MIELREVENKLDTAYNERKLKVEIEAIKKLKKNPKYFYTYAKTFSKTQSEIAAFLTKDGELTSDPFIQSEMLLQQYKSVASLPMAEFKVEDANFFMKDDEGYSSSTNEDEDQDASEEEQQNEKEKEQQKEQGEALGNEQEQEYRDPGKEVQVQEQQGEQQEHGCQNCAAQKVHACAVDEPEEAATQQHDTGQVPYRSQQHDTSQVPYRNQSPYGIPDGPDVLADPPLRPNEHIVDQTLKEVQFDHMNFRECIDQLSNGASPGQDGIPACMLKGAKIPISHLLNNIFKSSYESGDIPAILKLAHVIPIHKGGSRSEPVNFRPISLTSHV